jgi:hypothetical protein
MEDGFKTCQFCQEQIRASAIKCRFCGEYLEPPAKQPQTGFIEIDGVYLGATEPVRDTPEPFSEISRLLAVNGFILLAALVSVIYFSSIPTLSGLPAFGVCLYVLLAAALAWGVIACWRRSGNSGAKAAVACCGALGAALIGFGFVPPLIEKALIVADDIRSDGYQITVNDRDTELEFTGPLRFGAAKHLRRVLEVSPDVEALRLSSSGGRISEAGKIAELVRARQLKVIAKGQCVGPAVFVFLAGAERSAEKDAQIGFTEIPGRWVTRRRKALLDAFALDSFREANVKKEFAARALTTPAGDPWFPKNDALIEAGVLTEALLDCPPTDPLEVSRVEEPWSLRPLFQKVKLLDPGLYARLVEKVFHGMKAGETRAETASAVRRLIAPLARRHLLSTSDGALMAFRDYALQALETLGQTDPAACVELITFDSAEEVDGLSAFEARAVDIYEKILCDSSPVPRAEAPRPTGPLPEQWEIHAKIVKEFGDAARLIDQRSAWRNHSAELCPVLEMFCRESARAPRDRQPQILRKFAMLLSKD